jgi:NAD-dependent DNA ligase
MGNAAYAPGDVDSQELDILEENNDKSIKDDLIDNNFDGIVSNMEAVQRTPRTTDTAAPKRSSKEEQNNDDMVRSPQKVNQTTDTRTELPSATAANHAKAIKGMIREWYNNNGKTTLPPGLMALALQAGIGPAEIIPSCPTTPRRGKCKKTATPSAREGAVEGSLSGRRFVLSGMWPDLEEEAGLRSGKERVKSRIEWFGGKVTSAILGLTDTLIIGEKPGDKKPTQVHEKEVKVIDINTLNHLIMGELSLDEVQTKYASGQVALVQIEDNSVQRQSQTHMPTEQAVVGTAGCGGVPEVGHSNE